MDADVQTELVSGLPVKVVRGNEYDRIQVDGKTIAYAIARKGGIVLDFAYDGSKRKLPTKLKTSAFAIGSNGRAKFFVNGKNVAKGREVLEWLAAA